MASFLGGLFLVLVFGVLVLGVFLSGYMLFRRFKPRMKGGTMGEEVARKIQTANEAEVGYGFCGVVLGARTDNAIDAAARGLGVDRGVVVRHVLELSVPYLEELAVLTSREVFVGFSNAVRRSVTRTMVEESEATGLARSGMVASADGDDSLLDSPLSFHSTDFLGHGGQRAG